MAYIPVFLIVLTVFGLMVKKATLNKMYVVKGLGGVAEEILSAIKVVASFGREEKEIKKLMDWSLKAQTIGIKH